MHGLTIHGSVFITNDQVVEAIIPIFDELIVDSGAAINKGLTVGASATINQTLIIDGAPIGMIFLITIVTNKDHQNVVVITLMSSCTN